MTVLKPNLSSFGGVFQISDFMHLNVDNEFSTLHESTPDAFKPTNNFKPTLTLLIRLSLVILSRQPFYPRLLFQILKSGGR
jgi:hypothetical protein